MEDLSLRQIRPEDNDSLAELIRTVMPEFGASGSGFAINDAEVPHMFEAYSSTRAIYFVISDSKRVLGGGGIAPLAGADSDTCELRKMYFLPELRGKGWGKKMLKVCLDSARRMGFRKCYLETLTNMTQAQSLYQNFGFERLCSARGNTGHFGCDRWYELDLTKKSTGIIEHRTG